MLAGDNGQTTKDKSTSVVLASDHASVPVTITNASVDLTVDIDASNLATHADAVAINTKQTDGGQKTQIVGSAAAAMFPNAAALGDTDANPTTTTLGAALMGWTGAVFKRLLNGVITPGSTFTGMLNTIPWAKFDTTPTTRTTGQGGSLQAEADGSLRTSLATRIAGEDLSNDVLRTRDDYLHFQLATTSAGISCKAAPGFIHAIQIGAPATATIQIYDGLSATGTLLFDGVIVAGNPFSVLLNKKAVIGIWVVVVTAGVKLGISYA